MTLREKQSKFARMVADLIIKAYSLGYEITLGDAYRDPRLHGQQGVKGAGSNPSSEKEKARQRSFKARHAENISKGKMSAAYWADKVKW